MQPVQRLHFKVAKNNAVAACIFTRTANIRKMANTVVQPFKPYAYIT